MKRLSIIVPVYNVEAFVERCLRSLEDQDIPKNDYEIICINDGSTDNSRKVVEHLQSEFNNIVLIDQENQGVSRARNNGIDRSIGKYILFIDPDDYIESACFKRIITKADELNTQVLFLGYTILTKDGLVRYKAYTSLNTEPIYSGPETYALMRGDGITDPDRMVAVLFNTEFLDQHNLRYLPDVPYLEDGEFIVRILCLAERCIFDSNSFYQRTTRPGSATHSKLYYSDKATEGFLLAVKNLKRFQKEEKLNENQRVFLNYPVMKFVLLALNSAIGWGLLKRFSATIKQLNILDLRRVSLEGCFKKEIRIYGKAYNISPLLGALALVLYPRLERLYQIITGRKPV